MIQNKTLKSITDIIDGVNINSTYEEYDTGCEHYTTNNEYSIDTTNVKHRSFLSVTDKYIIESIGLKTGVDGNGIDIIESVFRFYDKTYYTFIKDIHAGVAPEEYLTAYTLTPSGLYLYYVLVSDQTSSSPWRWSVNRINLETLENPKDSEYTGRQMTYYSRFSIYATDDNTWHLFQIQDDLVHRFRWSEDGPGTEEMAFMLQSFLNDIDLKEGTLSVSVRLNTETNTQEYEYYITGMGRDHTNMSAPDANSHTSWIRFRIPYDGSGPVADAKIVGDHPTYMDNTNMFGILNREQNEIANIYFWNGVFYFAYCDFETGQYFEDALPTVYGNHGFDEFSNPRQSQHGNIFFIPGNITGDGNILQLGYFDVRTREYKIVTDSPTYNNMHEFYFEVKSQKILIHDAIESGGINTHKAWFDCIESIGNDTNDNLIIAEHSVSSEPFNNSPDDTNLRGKQAQQPLTHVTTGNRKISTFTLWDEKTNKTDVKKVGIESVNNSLIAQFDTNFIKDNVTKLELQNTITYWGNNNYMTLEFSDILCKNMVKEDNAVVNSDMQITGFILRFDDETISEIYPITKKRLDDVTIIISCQFGATSDKLIKTIDLCNINGLVLNEVRFNRHAIYKENVLMYFRVRDNSHDRFLIKGENNDKI